MSNSTIESDQKSKAQTSGENAVVTKFIVAVHGIGDQTEFGTIKTAAYRFFSYRGAPANIPLGSFHVEKLNDPTAPFLNIPIDSPETTLRFGEVYWATVPRDLVKQGYTLEETKRWAQTVVERFRARYYRKKKEYERKQKEKGDPLAPERELTRDDFSKVKQILLEMIESIRILERLVTLAEKAGLFKFSLGKILDDYVGDVQIVADFQQPRSQILDTFLKVMRAVNDSYPNAEIHIVAHSEGTVVSFLGLLTALNNLGPDASWVRRVRGYMTIGSPLDKHLLLWPELFQPFELDKRTPASRQETRLSAERIQWQNYYDYGDPIGFNLRKIRGWLSRNEWKEFFKFEDGDDHEFSRYFLPGKAHNDYWQDKEVFGHFIQNVVGVPAEGLAGTTAPDFSRAPQTKPWARILSYGVPYFLFGVLSFAAIFVLRKGILACMSPEEDPASALRVLRSVGLSALALSGLTAMAGIFRLTRTLRWRFYGVLLFALLTIPYWSLQWPGSRLHHFFDTVLAGTGSFAGFDSSNPLTLVLAIIFATLLVVLANRIIKMKPTWGLKPLLALIGAPVVALIWAIVHNPQNSPDREALWPLILSGAAAAYLWWLAALIFDLVFIWHYYVRHEAAMNCLREPIEASA